MQEYFGVLISDAVSKNNEKLATGALHTSLSKYWKTGLPMCVSHDAHRLMGWNIPVGIHLEPGLARLVAVSLLTENLDDSRQLEQVYRNRIRERVEESVGKYEPQLRELIGTALRGDEELADLSTAALIGPDLARRCFPKLFALEDKDGLVPIQTLELVQPGIYRQGPLVVFAHQFFRRSLSRLNNLNLELLSALDTLNTQPDVNVKIRLDSDAVGLSTNCRQPIEMQYWRGPLFDDDLSNIPTGVSRHEADERQRFFSLLSRTEFWWQSRKNASLNRREHIFEAEELRDHYTFGSQNDLYGCRYVHSIIDENTNRIEHLDGAIREYTDESLLERLETDIARAGRHTMYTKYWRADGDLPLITWKSLVYHHFRDNPLVGEYFGMAPNAPSAPAALGAAPALTRVVPHTNAAMGIRVALSYHRYDEMPLEQDRSIGMIGFVRTETEKQSFVDAEFLDLVKFARREGIDITIPSDVGLLAFEEHYHVFPLIRHRTHDAAEETLNCLRSFLQLWNDPERVLSFTLGVVTGQEEVRVSLLGGTKAMVNWLNRFTFPPGDLDARTVWVSSVSDYLNTLPTVCDEPSLFNVIKAEGIFSLPRVTVPRDWVKTNEAGSIGVELDHVNREDPAIGELLADGSVTGTFSALLLQTTCTKCGKDYRICACSKYADEGVVVRVDEFDPVSIFWTDRPA